MDKNLQAVFIIGGITAALLMFVGRNKVKAQAIDVIDEPIDTTTDDANPTPDDGFGNSELNPLPDIDSPEMSNMTSSKTLNSILN
tara:strand:+ start:59 stop:313 length:255 start_codon:yes stop_codon:yes gene_type:complete